MKTVWPYVRASFLHENDGRLPRILQSLKDRGFILGVVTADDFAPTELFLKQYQLESF